MQKLEAGLGLSLPLGGSVMSELPLTSLWLCKGFSVQTEQPWPIISSALAQAGNRASKSGCHKAVWRQQLRTECGLPLSKEVRINLITKFSCLSTAPNGMCDPPILATVSNLLRSLIMATLFGLLNYDGATWAPLIAAE